jgi:hypothetical protein
VGHWPSGPHPREIVVLEPDAVKVASPVLRGGWVSNDLSLPTPVSVVTLSLGKPTITKEYRPIPLVPRPRLQTTPFQHSPSRKPGCQGANQPRITTDVTPGAPGVLRPSDGPLRRARAHARGGIESGRGSRRVVVHPRRARRARKLPAFNAIPPLCRGNRSMSACSTRSWRAGRLPPRPAKSARRQTQDEQLAASTTSRQTTAASDHQSDNSNLSDEYLG